MAFAPASSINRYYDPATGQFVSVDPMVNETSQPYEYVGGDPVNGDDPLGLGSPWDFVGQFISSSFDTSRHTVAAAFDLPPDILKSSSTAIYNAYVKIYQDGANGCSFFSIATQEVIEGALFADVSLGLNGSGEGEEVDAFDDVVTDIGHAGDHQFPGVAGGKSQFYDGVNIGDLSDTSGVQGTLQANGNMRYVMHAPEDIGVDRTTGLPTNAYTVIRGPAGNTITIYPGTSPRS